MSESTIIALVILVCVFLTIALTTIKAGVDAAIKMWSVMGALTGVAFGAMTTYYFTDRVKRMEVAAVRSELTHTQAALYQATSKASDAEGLVTPFYSALSGEQTSSALFPESAWLAANLPDAERLELAARLERTTDLLNQIQELQARAVADSAAIDD